MCTVSNMGDHWRVSFPDRYPGFYPKQPPVSPSPVSPSTLPGVMWPDLSQVTRQEFEALKKDIQELKELLKAAKKYDEATNQKDCEMEDKVAFIRKMAEYVGVDMEEVFKK